MSNETVYPTYIELTKHTLLVARTRDGQLESYRECTFDNETLVEETLAAFAPDANPDDLRPVAAALSPAPVAWHLSTLEEAQRYRTEDALRKFAAQLPLPFSGPLELTACHAAEGSPLSAQGSSAWLLGLTPADRLAATNAAAADWRIHPSRIESSTLSHLGAIATALPSSSLASVALWELAADRSQLFLVTTRGVEAVARCEAGLDQIVSEIETAAGLKFRNAALRLFFNPRHDFSELGPRVAARVAPALRTALARLTLGRPAPELACAGLTGGQSWLVREAALIAGLRPWLPDLAAVCARFKLPVHPGVMDSLSVASLGLLHLVASQVNRKTAWHPAWTKTGTIPLAVAPSPLATNPVPSLATPASPTPSTPAQPPKISERTIASLRDEAYATLCRQSLTAALARVESERQVLIATRPPFGMLGSKKTRETYETSLSSSVHTAEEYAQKLQQVDRLEHWLESMIQENLHDYLTASSTEYQCYNHLGVLVERWQNCVGALNELVLAFAREARATATVLARSTGSRSAHLQAVASLRDTAANLHSEVVKIVQLASEVARLAAGRVPAGGELPALPAFRHAAWVDQVALLKPGEGIRELQRSETDAREFCSGGKVDLLLRAESTRSACLRARLDYLNRYWDQLRAHALQHYVKPRDVDEVLAELTQHYVAGDLKRRQREGGANPFANER